MRISDWSSDVCSSDLLREHFFDRGEIILALRPVAIIFRPGLPAFPRIVEPRGEAFVLLLLRDVNEQLDEVGSAAGQLRSEEHTSELQSLMRISYAVFCLKKKKKNLQNN